MNILFATQAYTYLKEELLARSSWENGELEIETFPDGETYHRIVSQVMNKKVILIGGTTNDQSTLELLDISMGLVQLGVRELNIVIPYFGYSTMERAIKQGEIVKAKTRASLFSTLVPSNSIVRIYLFDLHSEGIPYYFASPIFTHHVYCKKLIGTICHAISSDFVLAATDAGRAKWVESLAKDMGVSAAYAYKNRIDGSRTEVSGINADVKGRTVIIYDDMIRSGSTLLQAAKTYSEAGASSIYAVCTHGVFCDHALAKMKDQNLIKKVFCTNSNPITTSLSDDYVEIHSLAGIIFEAIGQ